MTASGGDRLGPQHPQHPLLLVLVLSAGSGVALSLLASHLHLATDHRQYQMYPSCGPNDRNTKGTVAFRSFWSKIRVVASCLNDASSTKYVS